MGVSERKKPRQSGAIVSCYLPLGSGTNHATIVFSDDYRGRAWHIGAAIWPRAANVTVFAWVLNVDEQGFAVRRKRQAGYLTLLWPHQEAADFFAHRVRSEHAVITLAGVVTRVGMVAVGLNPKATEFVKAQAVRAIEGVVGRHVAGARFRGSYVGCHGGVASQYKDIPIECQSGGVTTGFTPADDLTVDVAGSWVCLIRNSAA